MRTAEIAAICHMCVTAATRWRDLAWDVDRSRWCVRGRDPQRRYTLWVARGPGTNAITCHVRWHTLVTDSIMLQTLDTAQQVTALL